MTRRKSTRSEPRRPAIVLGWREWVALPDLGVPLVKAKLDTGARSSSLHVSSPKTFRREGHEWVRFVAITDLTGDDAPVRAEAPVADERMVRSSAGHEELRIVIETRLEIAGWQWDIDLTLADRPDTMSFRMLIGRQGLSGHALIDPSHSYLAGRPLKRRRRRKGA
jgi:hypothetical protein